MSYKVMRGEIFPYIKMGDYEVHIMTNFDLPTSEMDFSITTGKICTYRRTDIPKNDLANLIRDGEIFSHLTSADLSAIIEKNQNKLLHFVENHDDYMQGPPYPNYESIEN